MNRTAGRFLLTGAATLFSIAAAAQETLTIEEAIRLARERNELVAAAQQRVEASEARVRRARAFFFPDVNVSSNFTLHPDRQLGIRDGETVTIRGRENVATTANLNSVLFNARAFPLYRQARLDRQSQTLSASQTRRIIGFEAADAYLLTLSAEQVLQATQRRAEFARGSLADARARFDAGLVSSNDVTRAELELASAELELARGRAAADNAHLELANLLNAEIPRQLAEPTPLLAAASESRPDPQQLADAASRERLDIAAERTRIASLREFAREPRMRFIPNLNLNGQYRAEDEGGVSGFDDDRTLGLTLGWTPWDGGEAMAESAERRAAVRQAELELQLDERGVATDIRQAVSTLASEQTAIDHADTAARVARKNYDEASELYRQGLASALEVADAAVRLFEAEVAQARARYQLALAFLDVRAASGLEPLPGSTDPAVAPQQTDQRVSTR
jgi:outer membrane protein TolC